MHTTELDSTSTLIARGRQLKATIDAAERELAGIENVLRTRALAMPHAPLTDGNREGRRATLRDDDQAVTVLFESDILKTSFAADSATGIAVKSLLLSSESDELFRRKTTLERSIKDGQKFRLKCTEILRPDLAPKLIDLLKDRDRNGIVKSKSVIEWKNV